MFLNLPISKNGKNNQLHVSIYVKSLMYVICSIIGEVVSLVSSMWFFIIFQNWLYLWFYFLIHSWVLCTFCIADSILKDCWVDNVYIIFNLYVLWYFFFKNYYYVLFHCIIPWLFQHLCDDKLCSGPYCCIDCSYRSGNSVLHFSHSVLIS